ncbi:MAG: hypothetical protein ACXW1W_16990 [Methylococcaceae bacterium]
MLFMPTINTTSDQWWAKKRALFTGLQTSFNRRQYGSRVGFAALCIHSLAKKERFLYEIKTTHIDILAVINKRRDLQAEEISREL